MRKPAALLLLSLTAAAANAAAPTHGTVPRTADGVPDLQGIWTGGTLTPLERPPALANQPFIADADLAEHQRHLAETFWAAGHKAGEVGRDNDAFIDELHVLPNGQTALVVNPPDGRVPLRADVESRKDRNLTSLDSYATMSQWDRCITREPTPLLPVIYNNAYQIVQTPTFIMIVAEMIHDARIIPLDGRPHLDARIRSWSGDSRGHWDGATLVVDTTNFNDQGWIATGLNAGRIRGVPHSKDLHIVERFTRIDAQTLDYSMTIDDPQIYAAPWTVAFPLQRDDGYRIFEYACHEGNHAIELILGGARAQEQLMDTAAAKQRDSK